MRHTFCNDYEKMFENIIEFTCDYIDKSNIKTLVLGMSGGIDSTLTAALAKEVCSKSSADIRVEGRIINIESDYVEIARAILASEAFCHRFELNNMTDIYDNTSRFIINNFSSNGDLIRKGNIKARLRMIKLYDLAKQLQGLVLSTDNYTEYLLGFWTLHGDVGDYGMLQNLWKTEVYGLANYLINKYNMDNMFCERDVMIECIKAIPTDGLGISDSDFDQIHPGYNKTHTSSEVYGEIDSVLLDHLNGGYFFNNSKIIQRYKETEFKRTNPFSIPRQDIVG